jgi:hypothetical protein
VSDCHDNGCINVSVTTVNRLLLKGSWTESYCKPLATGALRLNILLHHFYIANGHRVCHHWGRGRIPRRKVTHVPNVLTVPALRSPQESQAAPRTAAVPFRRATNYDAGLMAPGRPPVPIMNAQSCPLILSSNCHRHHLLSRPFHRATTPSSDPRVYKTIRNASSFIKFIVTSDFKIFYIYINLYINFKLSKNR